MSGRTDAVGGKPSFAACVKPWVSFAEAATEMAYPRQSDILVAKGWKPALNESSSCRGNGPPVEGKGLGSNLL
jgi:hypothetical protein